MIKKLIAGSLICGLVGYAMLSTSATDVHAEIISSSNVGTIKNNFKKYVQNHMDTTISYYDEILSEDGNTKNIIYKDNKLLDVTIGVSDISLYLDDFYRNNNIPIKLIAGDYTSNYTSNGVSTSLKVMTGEGFMFESVSAGVEFDFDYTRTNTHSRETDISISIMPLISEETYESLSDNYKSYYSFYENKNNKNIYSLELGKYSLYSIMKVQMYYVLKLKLANAYKEKEESNKNGTYTVHEDYGKVWVLDSDSDDILYSNKYYVNTNITKYDVGYIYNEYKPIYSIVKVD